MARRAASRLLSALAPLAALHICRAAAAGEDATALLQTRAGLPDAPEQGPEALWEALESPAVVSSDSFRQTLVNFGDAQYIAYMTLGRQMITGIVDTGSYELVVFGADCQSCGAAAHYNHHISHSYLESPLSVEQYYGSGRIISNAARERLAIGPFRAFNQSFWNVKYAQMPVLNGAPFEAILGLGPPDTPVTNAWDGAEAAVEQVISFYDRGVPVPEDVIAMAKRSIDMANDVTAAPPPLRSVGCTRFSICLGAKSGSDGLLVWNDTAHVRQPELFARVSVVGNHSWSVLLFDAGLGYSMKGSNQVLTCQEGCTALVDSGTSILSAPTPIINALKQALGLLDANCSNLNAMPSLAFKLGGAQLTLPPDSYLAMVTADRPRFLQGGETGVSFPGNPGQRCQLLIRETTPGSTSGPLWVLGMPFLRRYYTTFDLGERLADRALFVAPHKQDSCTPSTDGAVAASHEHQLRSVALSKLRLLETGRIAPLAAAGKLRGRRSRH